jgi:HK97 gp10 family phage protein
MKVDMYLEGNNNIFKNNFDTTQQKIMNKVIEATKMVEGDAKEYVVVNTGELRGSIKGNVSKEEYKFVGKVGTNKVYAPFVEFGTGIIGNGTYPYEIDGIDLKYKNKGWWYPAGEIGGKTIFKYTKGQVAKPFLHKALLKNKSKIKEMFKGLLGG